MARKISLYSLLIATIVVLSLMVLIPVPATSGFVTLCDAGIYAVSLTFGPLAGAVVGGLSGGMIDFFSGYPQWMFFSVVIHGLQGFIAGTVYQKRKRTQFLGVVIGSVVMILGYALATALLYGQAAGWASILGNFMQSGFGLVAGIPLSHLLKRAVAASYMRQKQKM